MFKTNLSLKKNIKKQCTFLVTLTILIIFNIKVFMLPPSWNSYLKKYRVLVVNTTVVWILVLVSHLACISPSVLLYLNFIKKEIGGRKNI